MNPGIPLFIISVLIIIAGISVLYIVFGEPYKFNMTTELENESRLLAACIAFEKMDVYIPDCGMIYGGIQGNYGEPLK